MFFKQTACTLEKHPGTPEGYLFHADNRDVDLSAFTGQVQCVYMDPPYLTGSNYEYHCRVGREGWETGKKQIRLTAYTDRYDKQAYLALLRAALEKAYTLLNDTGSVFLHMDSRMCAYGRLLCDEIFGERNFVNEIIWAYQSGGRSTRHFSRKHDVILFYQKSKNLFFDITQVPVSRADNRQNHLRRSVDEHGRSYRSIKVGGKTYTYYDDEPVYPSDVWSDVSHLQQKDPQRTGYDTQKPRALLDRIILSTTKPGDMVADLFGGSGTALVSAAANGRKYLGVDSSASAIAVSQKRLLGYGTRLYTQYGCEGASIEADVMPGIGLTDVHLVSYSVPDLREIAAGTDGVECWSVGFLRDDGCFEVSASFGRSKLTPEIPPVLQLPQLSGRMAMTVTDILGRHTCWIAE